MAKGSDLRVLFGALVGVGAGGVLLLTVVPLLAPATGTDAVPAAQPVAVTEDAPTARPTEGLDIAAPRFDTVRVAPDGSGLVAGQAVPGAAVAVMAGEEVAAEVTADADGRFVAFLDLPPSAEPRALSLRAGDGTFSEETVIVAPTGGQVAGEAGDGPLDRPEVASLAGQGGLATSDGAEALGAGGPGETWPEGPTASGDPPAEGAQQGTGVTSQVSAVEANGSPEGTGLASAIPSDIQASSENRPATGAEVGAAPSIAVVAAGPDGVSPDLLPEVAEGPDGLPVPEGGTTGQSAVLLSDAEGVRVLQPALAPGADAEVLSTVALDAIAYGQEGEVTLSGRASEAGAVRLYLDNAPVAEAPVGPDGQWSTILSGTRPGDYTLRVDQMDAAGEVVSRIETPFRREARSDLAAAMAQAQEPGQTIAVRTVQPGNTLWAIARDRYGEPLMYVRVYEMNRDRIRNPDLIYPGQVFVMPAVDGR